MAIPSAVQRQGDRAAEIQAAIIAGQDPTAAPPATPAPGNTPPQGTPTPPATPAPPAAPVPPAVAEPVPPAPPVAPAPQAPEPPAPAPLAPPPVDYQAEAARLKGELEKEQQKYRVLQGKYDAEVPRLTYRVAFLENQIEEMRRTPPAAAIPTAAPAAPASPLTNIADVLRNSTDEKIRNYRENWPDMFDGLLAMIDQAASTVMANTANQIASVKQESAKNSQQKFSEALNAAVPDWQTICQTDPNWPVFLSQKDRYSPRTRLELLKEASEAFDAQSVINLITDFKAAFPPAIPPVPPTHRVPENPPAIPLTPSPAVPATPPAAPGPAPFVAPPSGPSHGAPPAPPQAEYITRAFINAFYKDVATGRYRGREAEMKETEAKIQRATVEGRIV